MLKPFYTCPEISAGIAGLAGRESRGRFNSVVRETILTFVTSKL